MRKYVHQGMMGTNYCKNLTLDGVQFNTFDCHHSCYNVTVRNSTLVYVSAIGEELDWKSHSEPHYRWGV